MEEKIFNKMCNNSIDEDLMYSLTQNIFKTHQTLHVQLSPYFVLCSRGCCFSTILLLVPVVGAVNGFNVRGAATCANNMCGHPQTLS